jgi:hypothetical protein
MPATPENKKKIQRRLCIILVSDHQVAGHYHNMKVTNRTLKRRQSLNIWE